MSTSGQCSFDKSYEMTPPVKRSHGEYFAFFLNRLCFEKKKGGVLKLRVQLEELKSSNLS